MPELEYHPIAEDYPRLSPDQLRALAADIKAKGLRDPIILFEGKILDGRHRYEACLTENVDPIFKDYEGEDPVGFVLSKNYHRRHLTKVDQLKLAKAIVRDHPERTSREIARETGVSHPTVEKIRRQKAKEDGNGNAFHYEQDSLRPGSSIEQAPHIAEGGEPTSLSEAAPPAAMPSAEPVQRITAAGKRAPGRKAGAVAKDPKVAKPKPLSNPREERIETASNWLRLSPKETLIDLVQLISGYDGILQAEISMPQRQELVTKFAKALAVEIVI